jgi:hypothetical protein
MHSFPGQEGAETIARVEFENRRESTVGGFLFFRFRVLQATICNVLRLASVL